MKKRKWFSLYWLVHESDTVSYRYFLSVSFKSRILFDLMFGRLNKHMLSFEDGMRMATCPAFMVKVFGKGFDTVGVFPRPRPVEAVYDKDWNTVGYKRLPKREVA